MAVEFLTIPGFEFAGVRCGVKDRGGKDLALIYSEVPAVAAGTFTTHPAAAAPVALSRRVIGCGLVQAVVINSGNANAATGRKGWNDARAMVHETARSLRVAPSRVLVCSTGVIGVPLPIKRILAGIRQASRRLSPQEVASAAQAILTTDRSVKGASARGLIGKTPYRVTAFAKGAGMIEPHMALASGRQATMLAFIMTDLALERRFAQWVLHDVVRESFNRISVDGDTSTNDTCLLLANGRAGNRPLQRGMPGARRFQRLLQQIASKLAFMMVADGEGATKVVTIAVRRARSSEEARRIAYGVAHSPLVRTSFYGADPNWGRVLAAVGNSGATVSPRRVDIFYGGVRVCRNGAGVGAAAERKAKRLMQKQEFTVLIDCRSGQASHHILASDLTLDYVKINSHYKS